MLELMSNLDLQTVFGGADGSITESEALEVKALLEASGIEAFIVNESPIASLGHDVRVAKKDFTAAKRVIADAREVGSRGAEEAERSTES
jgi:hypothetical protein